MLLCRDIAYAYKGVMRVKGVSFQVPRGCLFALFGHNGSGKSTLLKMLGGSLPVGAGQIFWQDQTALCARGYLKQGLRKDVGVLFQSSSSDEKLSVLDNLIFSARLYGLTHAQATARAREIVHIAALADRAHDAVKKLSGGMRRRLELYRCFIHDPQLVLLDEPTAGLDVVEVRNFFNFLKQYKERKNAVIIMASHHAEELLFADQIAMMKDGEVLLQDTPSAMLARLEYLCCSFSLDYSKNQVINGLQLFDCEDHPDGSISAKFSANYLDELLKSNFVRDASFSSLSIERPSLADVYRDVTDGVSHG